MATQNRNRGETMKILEARDLHKHFGGLAATSGVDVDVEAGEILGLIGPNGAGKTTLFNLLSGALVPNAGSIHYKGQDITGMKPHKIARMGVARTFQSVKVFSHMTVLENVLLGNLFGAGQSMSSSTVKRAREILDFVGLSQMERLNAIDLTLANQKRLEVARAMATSPDLLLLDEVMAGLTPTEVSEAMELVRKIRDAGITVVMIEHVMKAIMTICDRIFVLHYGEKIAEGTPEEIVANKKVIEIYLGD
jgi:branched-chain amino acid transport system ATP-binding protein